MSMNTTTEAGTRRARRSGANGEGAGVALQDLEGRPLPAGPLDRPEPEAATAADLEPVYDVPVTVSAVLGRSRMEVTDLLSMEGGKVIELDRKVGEAVDIFVNGRLIARGEVVLVEGKLGVTMTEILRADR